MSSVMVHSLPARAVPAAAPWAEVVILLPRTRMEGVRLLSLVVVTHCPMAWLTLPWAMPWPI